MTDLIEKMAHEISRTCWPTSSHTNDDPLDDWEIDAAIASASILLREMMEPSDEMWEAAGSYSVDRYSYQAMLKAFAKSHSIDIGEKDNE